MCISTKNIVTPLLIVVFACAAVILELHPVHGEELGVDGAYYLPASDTLLQENQKQPTPLYPNNFFVPEIILETLENTRSLIDEQPGPVRIGVNRDIPQLSSYDGSFDLLEWNENADGGHIAELKFTSPSAAAIRLGIKISNLPASAELRFYEIFRPDESVILVTGDKINDLIQLNLSADPGDPDSNLYWSPTVSGESIGLQIYLPPGVDTTEVDITIPSLSHLVDTPFTQSSDESLQGYGDSDSCQNDVTCYPNWSNIRRAVAKMIYTKPTGTYICTGTLLNDRDQYSWIPYFISANHCISTQAAATSLETIWFYESSNCNGSVLNANYRRLSGGAQLLWSRGVTTASVNSNMDTSFLRLLDSPPYGAYFSGWNSAIISSGSKVGVHHPRGDWKKISFGNTTAGRYKCWSTGAGYFSCTASSGGSFVKVTWSDGGTEKGSSGSGLYHNNDQIVGDLTGGGGGSCAGSYSYYSTFSAAYAAGNLGRWLYRTIDRPIFLPGVDLLLSKDRPSREVIFYEGFERGSLTSVWTTRSTGSGRILVTGANGPHSGSYHLTMDSSQSTIYSLNELVLKIDLASRKNVILSLYQKEFSDENNAMPASFIGSSNSDGIAISSNGITWYKIKEFTGIESTSTYTRSSINLDAAIQAAGISYNSTFRIKFQQYDNFPIPTDGFALDGITLSADEIK